jgi:hypothetical protein
MASDLTLVHCSGLALDLGASSSSSEELLSSDAETSASDTQQCGRVVCFIVVAVVAILALVKVLTNCTKETLLLATGEVKRILVVDKWISVAEDGFSSPTRVTLFQTLEDRLQERYNY